MSECESVSVCVKGSFLCVCKHVCGGGVFDCGSRLNNSVTDLDLVHQRGVPSSGCTLECTQNFCDHAHFFGLRACSKQPDGIVTQTRTPSLRKGMKKVQSKERVLTQVSYKFVLEICETLASRQSVAIRALVHL